MKSSTQPWVDASLAPSTLHSTLQGACVDVSCGGGSGRHSLQTCTLLVAGIETAEGKEGRVTPIREGSTRQCVATACATTDMV
eukprot:366230-Chlamydomonas_euryale.AAC.30